jgi:hypothetical protein
MAFLLALLMVAHGLAHLVGFVVAWEIRAFPETPFHTTILNGSIDVGLWGTRAVGLLWLLAAMAFVFAASGVALRQAWWPVATTVVITASLMLCVVGWPEARIGVYVNLVVAALLLAGYRLGWLGVGSA